MYATTVKTAPFDVLLIANRGEIALRIIRTARALGYRTVAVFSDADADSPHVHAADEAVRIGPADVSASYLDADALLSAARATGAEAIIPGYGFLSENAGFAQAVIDAGLVWVGPPPAAIDAMGNKAAAKARMRTADVPCVPGYESSDGASDELAEAAARIGYPVLVKAAAGGGGRGMRRVDHPSELSAALASARREAKNAFGDDGLLLERLVLGGRHVEIQVFGDTHGTVVHLGERDCSVQRRHQKVVEEAPSPAVNEELRDRMGRAACAAAQAVGYVGAGTVEFLLAPSGDFYFLEMNTRLQVEHPVTECITGFDLVEWQLRVAAGEPIPMAQEDLALNGHAIEVRLYAEDPTQGGLPQPGPVFAYVPPADIRVDDGLSAPGQIAANYDPMVAKLIAHGSDRSQARRRLRRSLDALVFFGPRTNRDQLAAILDHEDFVGGEVHTGWLEAHPELDGTREAPGELSAVAIGLYLQEVGAGVSFRSAPRGPARQVFAVDGETVEAHTEVSGRTVTVRVGEAEWSVIVGAKDGAFRRIRVGDVVRTAQVVSAEHSLWVRYRGVECRIAPAGFAPSSVDERSDGRVRMPMTGTVLQVNVEHGAEVEAGQPLVVVEAMKLETTLRAPHAGTVTDLRVSVGDSVPTDTVLLRVEAAETDNSGTDKES